MKRPEIETLIKKLGKATRAANAKSWPYSEAALEVARYALRLEEIILLLTGYPAQDFSGDQLYSKKKVGRG